MIEAGEVGFREIIVRRDSKFEGDESMRALRASGDDRVVAIRWFFVR